MISPCLSAFPETPSAIADAGMSLGCVVCPLASFGDRLDEEDPGSDAEDDPSDASSRPYADEVDRCQACGAYINPYCSMLRRDWRCSLCDALNPQGKRYRRDVSYREGLLELTDYCIELDFEQELSNGDSHDEQEHASSPPVFVAAVDASAGDDAMDVVRAALHAALAALPSDALFGLVVFSDTIGAYIIGAPRPHVRHIPIPSGSGEALSLLDAVGLERWLVPVGTHGDAISAAVETIGRCSDATAWQKSDGRSCGLGAAMHAIVDAFAATPELTAPRILLFLGTRPNYASGALPPPHMAAHDDQAGSEGEQEDRQEQQSLEKAGSQLYYESLAHEMVCISAAAFVYALSSEPLGLSSLQALASRTGGILNLYADLDDCTLPEDVYKQLSRPFASQGMLRVRTSPELVVSHAYGPVVEDTAIQQLYHLAGCHGETAAAFGFEFASSSGFSEENERYPTIQVAYTYTCTVPYEDEGVADAQSGAPVDSAHAISPRARVDPVDDGRELGSRAAPSLAGGDAAEAAQDDPDPAPGARPLGWRRVRRLRVQTTQFPLARSARQLYDSINDRVLMTLLTHKVVGAIEAEGYQEGRLLLQDWLVLFLAKYQQHYGSHPDSILHPEHMCPAVASIPRWVYGLLRGPLLSSHTPLSAHRLSTDLRTWMYTLYRSLPAPDLCTAIRPSLSAWSSPQSCEHRSLPCTWDAVRRSGCHLFILDAYTHIYVYALAAGVEESTVAMPPSLPPKSSVLWKQVLALKQQRLRTARILVCQSGTPAGAAFESYIDSAHDAADVARAGQQGMFTFGTFLRFIHSELVATG